MLTARCTLHDPLSARPQFVPASVISGFLSCIGYKVIKLAVFVGTTHELKFIKFKYLVTPAPGKAAQHGQNGRLGGVMAGHHGLL